MEHVDERQLAIDCAVEEATEVAIVQGIKQGIKLGVKKGERKGERRLLNAAKNMLAKGYSVADIRDITNLSQAQIRALRA
jgi:hypothetical protein